MAVLKFAKVEHYSGCNVTVITSGGQKIATKGGKECPQHENIKQNLNNSGGHTIATTTRKKDKGKKKEESTAAAL